MQAPKILKRQKYTGAIDDLSINGDLRGWISQIGSDTQVEIEVRVGKIWSTQATANVFRADVKQHLQNSGTHAFQIELPDVFFDGEPHLVTVHVQGKPNPVLQKTLSALDVPLDGSLDGLTDFGQLVGWAGRKKVPLPMDITLFVDDLWRLPVTCDQFRGDLAPHLGTKGNHSFEITPHDDLFTGIERHVKICAADGTVLDEQDVFFPNRGPLNPPATQNAPQASWRLQTSTRGRIKGIVTSPKLTGASQVVLHNTAGEHCHAPIVWKTPAAQQGPTPSSEFEISVPLTWREEEQRPIRIALDSDPACTRPLHPWKGASVPSVLLVSDADDPKDGSLYYRAELAARQLKASGLATRIVSRTFLNSKSNTLKAGHYDVIIFQRTRYEDTTVNLLKDAQRTGTLCLYEADDLLFKPWRRGESGVVRSGTVALSNKDHKQGMELRLKLMQLCDGVITSTHYLQREIRSLGLTPLMSRNCVETEALKYGAMRLAQYETGKSDLQILFMSGTPTHNADFALIEDVLYHILTRYPNTGLTLMGRLGPTKLDSLDRVLRRPILPRARMLSAVSKHDLVLAPLERSGFNTGKSSLKFIESGACGVPVISSDLYEFRRDIRASGGGFVANSAESWLSSIAAFCETPDLSYTLGTKAFAYVAKNYTTDARADHLWTEIKRLHHHATNTAQTIRQRAAATFLTESFRDQ